MGTNPIRQSVSGKHAKGGMLTLYLMVSVLFSNASKSQFNKFCNFDRPEPGLIRDDIPRYLSSVILRRLISV